MAKRKPTLKQVFNAWIKYQKKESEAYKAKQLVQQLARQVGDYSTELINHGEDVYRVTTKGSGWNAGYQVERIAKVSELPTKIND